MTPVSSSDTLLRKAYQLSLAVLGLMLIGSIVWYKQRMLFLDPAWISFDIINRQSLSIQEHRYGSFVSQIWPLLGTYLNLPLRVVLMLYSASFYIFYLIVALILGRLQQYSLGILLVCYFSLIVSDSYFWPNNEVHQGIGWMMLFLGAFFRYQSRGSVPLWIHPILIVSLFLAVFCHFVVIVPFTFLWVYWLLYNKEYWDTRAKRIQLGAYAILFAAIFLTKLYIGSNSGGYDSAKLAPVLHVKPREIFASFFNGGARSMYRLLLRNYWIIIPLFVWGMMQVVRRRQWARFIWTGTFALGYFSLVCLTYPNEYGRSLVFYMESEWMAWSLVLVTPFVTHVLPNMKPRLALSGLAIVFLLRIVYIGRSYFFFDAHYQKVDAITEHLHRSGKTKVVLIGEQQEREAAFIMDWAAPYESILLSGIKGYEPQVSYLVAEPNYKLPDSSAELFVSPFHQDSVQKLNSRYFRVDGTRPYQIMQLRDVLHEQ